MGFESFGSCSCCEASLHGGNHNVCEDCKESMCDECTKDIDGESVCKVCHAHRKNVKRAQDIPKHKANIHIQEEQLLEKQLV